MPLSPKFRNVFFDLDGTLVDSRAGIQAAAGAAFKSCGREPVDVTPFIGPPIRKIFSAILGEVPDMEELVAAYRAAYDHGGWKLTTLSYGARELLDALGDRSVFLVTNKPARPTDDILRMLGLAERFQFVACLDTFQPNAKSKGEMLGRVMRLFGTDPQCSVFIGDTQEDFEAASENGMEAPIVTNGYGTQANGLPHTRIASILELH